MLCPLQLAYVGQGRAVPQAGAGNRGTQQATGASCTTIPGTALPRGGACVEQLHVLAPATCGGDDTRPVHQTRKASSATLWPATPCWCMHHRRHAPPWPGPLGGAAPTSSVKPQSFAMLSQCAPPLSCGSIPMPHPAFGGTALTGEGRQDEVTAIKQQRTGGSASAASDAQTAGAPTDECG